MRKPTLYESIVKGIADGIADVREKVVEEPWFGRVVNERDPATAHWPESRDTQREPDEHDRESDVDIDR